MNEVLVVKDLKVSYEHSSALWGIDFVISSGQIVGIIGPNGAGKSTLLKALLGIIKPISGTAEFFGQCLKKIKERVAYVPQKEIVDWQFPTTVFDVVLMGRYPYLGLLKWYRKSDKQKATCLLKLMQMESLKDRQISELSGGQQQRLFIARALMQEAELLILDEPFAGVDKVTEMLIMDVLVKLKAEGKTILMVHHDLNTVEAYFDSLIILKTSLIACGKTKDVFCADNLHRAYGEKGRLFDEALRLSINKSSGLK